MPWQDNCCPTTRNTPSGCLGPGEEHLFRKVSLTPSSIGRLNTPGRGAGSSRPARRSACAPTRASGDLGAAFLALKRQALCLRPWRGWDRVGRTATKAVLWERWAWTGKAPAIRSGPRRPTSLIRRAGRDGPPCRPAGLSIVNEHSSSISCSLRFLHCLRSLDLDEDAWDGT